VDTPFEVSDKYNADRVEKKNRMADLPKGTALKSIPDLGTSDSEILARYLIAKPDADRGADAMIAEGIGYGVGQITDANGLQIIPCKGMLSDKQRSRISHILARGIVDAEWCYVDIGIDANVIDLNVLGFTGLLSLLAGDVFGGPYVRKGLVLQNFSIPSCAMSVFPGPRFGLESVLEKCGASHTGIILGLLLKPDMGVPPKYYADLAEAAAQGGIDYIKEDELTLDSSTCRRLSRVESICKRLKACGSKTLYAANATAPAYNLPGICRQIVGCGASALLINGLQVGLDAVAQIAVSPDISVPIHLHRAGYDILTTRTKAISTACLTEMFRLSGADIIHVGSPLGGIFLLESVSENIRCLTRKIRNVKRSLPLFSRSSIDTLEMVLSSSLARQAILLFDAYLYESPIGLERSIRRLKDRIE